MAENYKHLYEQTKKMLTMYQDELIPGFRKKIEELEAKVATDNNVGSKWIPVTERLPEDLPENKGKKVINCIVAHSPYANGKLTSQFRQRKLDNWDNKWYWSKIGGCTVTHWMPLPEPPKEVE
jgi:acetone carboxylase gamma subunit